LHFCDVTLTAKKPQSESYPKVLQTVGDHLGKKRLDLKLLQKDVAGILGVNTNTITNWEKNRCQPKLYLIPKIIRFLGYTPFSNNEESTLSEAIKAYRLMHGLSQKKLAKGLGVDPTTLARWENSTSKPGKRLRKRLAGLLGITAGPILHGAPTGSGQGPLSH
jgi:transcriptional regulator with XRE-family HTH domain